MLRESKHGTSQLMPTGKCPAHIVYIWPDADNGHRWIGIIGKHNHMKPFPHKISTKVQFDIQTAAQANLSCTAKQLTKGQGMAYIPGEKSLAAVDIDRVRRERRLALGVRSSSSKTEGEAMNAIMQFDGLREKIIGRQDESSELTSVVNSMMGGYKMQPHTYSFNSERKHAFLWLPI